MKLRKLSRIVVTKVKFLWRPYFIANALNIVEGDPNVGKSYLLMYLVAILSCGGKLPDGTRLEASMVFYLSAEDDPGYTIRPRIEAMGGDASRIFCLRAVFSLTEEGLEELKSELDLHHPRLIIIDTLFSFTPDYIDTSKPTAVREFLWQLSDMAKAYDTTIILIRHWTKGERGKAIYRGGGLIDFAAVARSVVAVAKNPENPDERVMAHVKHNLSECGPTRIFALEKRGQDNLPVLVWKGVSELTADQIEGSNGQPPAVIDVAVDFLETALDEGPVPQKKIEASAKRWNISQRTLARAKQQLGIKSSKEKSGWTWSLPRKKGPSTMPK
jgi:DNA repair protein RadA/Sms